VCALLANASGPRDWDLASRSHRLWKSRRGCFRVWLARGCAVEMEIGIVCVSLAIYRGISVLFVPPAVNRKRCVLSAFWSRAFRFFFQTCVKVESFVRPWFVFKRENPLSKPVRGIQTPSVPTRSIWLILPVVYTHL